jgi:hypothetical protein
MQAVYSTKELPPTWLDRYGALHAMHWEDAFTFWRIMHEHKILWTTQHCWDSQEEGQKIAVRIFGLSDGYGCGWVTRVGMRYHRSPRLYFTCGKRGN